MLRLPCSLSRTTSLAFRKSPLFKQQRFYETDSVDLLQMKKGDYFIKEGVLHMCQSRMMKSSGRGAAQGIMQAVFVKTGKHTEIKGQTKFEKVHLEKTRLYFDDVDENTDTLTLRVFDSDEGEPVPTDQLHTVDEKGFEALIDGGGGAIKWLLPDMPLSGILFDDALVSLKMPVQYNFTVKRVSQLGSENMALLEENDIQIPIASTSCKPGDKITVRLPKGRFIKKVTS